MRYQITWSIVDWRGKWETASVVCGFKECLSAPAKLMLCGITSYNGQMIQDLLFVPFCHNSIQWWTLKMEYVFIVMTSSCMLLLFLQSVHLIGRGTCIWYIVIYGCAVTTNCQHLWCWTGQDGAALGFCNTGLFLKIHDYSVYTAMSCFHITACAVL